MLTITKFIITLKILWNKKITRTSTPFITKITSRTKKWFIFSRECMILFFFFFFSHSKKGHYFACAVKRANDAAPSHLPSWNFAFYALPTLLRQYVPCGRTQLSTYPLRRKKFNVIFMVEEIRFNVARDERAGLYWKLFSLFEWIS